MLSKIKRSSQLEAVTNNEGGCTVGGNFVRQGVVERGVAGDKIDDSLSLLSLYLVLSTNSHKHHKGLFSHPCYLNDSNNLFIDVGIFIHKVNQNMCDHFCWIGE